MTLAILWRHKLVIGAATVIKAMGAGKEAAASIDEYLRSR